MLVGICELELLIYEANSLKEKRSVIKSLIGRLKSRYNVSIIELRDHDIWNKGVIGFSVVGNSKDIIQSSLSTIIGFIDKDYRVEIIDKSIEIL